MNVQEQLGQTALHIAVNMRNLQILKCKYSVNLKELTVSLIDFFYWIDMEPEHEKCVKILILNGATINVKDNEGNEPLQSAINAGIFAVFR